MSGSDLNDNRSDNKNRLIDIDDIKKNIEPDEDDISIDSQPDEIEDNFFESINKSLSRQVMEELGDMPKDENEQNIIDKINKDSKKSSKKKKIIFSVLAVLVVFIGFVFGTKLGRTKVLYKIIGMYINSRTEGDGNGGVIIDPVDIITPTPGIGDNNNSNGEAGPTTIPKDNIRKEDYVMNFLIFGIEEIGGARNTDTMMIASLNIKDKSIKLASLMRDTYTEVEGHKPSKLNAVYAMKSDRAEGAALLISQIEKIYHIDIAGYASVNFASFESIVDMLGGVSIELTAREAEYLNSTNYISNPIYRNVKAGVNVLNGNQAVGYCRVRKVPTLGGVDSDYGRTLRQRRVLTAMFNKYKSKNLIELINIADRCLSYVRTNLTSDDIAKGIEMALEYGISDIKNARFPAEDSYYDCGTKAYNGLKYTLIIDDEKLNITELYKFIYGDTDEEAEANYEKYK